jgi:hypothetical protein
LFFIIVYNKIKYIMPLSTIFAEKISVFLFRRACSL